MTDYATMSGPQLVIEYNRIATERGLPTVKRFSTTAAGRKRCEALMNGAAPRAAPAPRSTSGIDIFAEFKTATSKLRGKLLKALADNKGGMVGLAALIRSVYGSTNLDHRGALLMVMRGLENSIRKDRLPYRIEKSKSDTGVISYGIFDKT
jgi:hypothetical protein